jgi:hypothetical protein
MEPSTSGPSRDHGAGNHVNGNGDSSAAETMADESEGHSGSHKKSYQGKPKVCSSFLCHIFAFVSSNLRIVFSYIMSVGFFFFAAADEMERYHPLADFGQAFCHYLYSIGS